jgi:hypothetical protein
MEPTRMTATIAGRVPGLPYPLTSLVGRDAGVAAVCALACAPGIRLLTRGRSNQETAAALHFSVVTVKTHVAHVLANLALA